MPRFHLLPALAVCLAPVIFVGCTSSDESAEEEEENAPSRRDSIWTYLTGDAEHWRAYRGEGLPSAWVPTEDGGLHFTGEGSGGDIVTVDRFKNFILELEWKISPGGNSGIMFRVSEDHDFPWRTGPEFQILDDERHPDAREGRDRRAGANYDMHAPTRDVVKPAGEWNEVKLVAQDEHVEHWMNGQRIVSYRLWTDEWKERIADSKWIDMPDYGMKEEGHICLQDHGDQVWFRNIRIRALLPM